MDELIGRAPVGEDRTAGVDGPRPSGRAGADDVILCRPAEQTVVEGGPPSDRQVEIPIHPEDRIWVRRARRDRVGTRVDVDETFRPVRSPVACATRRDAPTYDRLGR